MRALDEKGLKFLVNVGEPLSAARSSELLPPLADVFPPDMLTLHPLMPIRTLAAARRAIVRFGLNREFFIVDPFSRRRLDEELSCFMAL